MGTVARNGAEGGRKDSGEDEARKCCSRCSIWAAREGEERGRSVAGVGTHGSVCVAVIER